MRFVLIYTYVTANNNTSSVIREIRHVWLLDECDYSIYQRLLRRKKTCIEPEILSTRLNRILEFLACWYSVLEILLISNVSSLQNLNFAAHKILDICIDTLKWTSHVCTIVKVDKIKKKDDYMYIILLYISMCVSNQGAKVSCLDNPKAMINNFFNKKKCNNLA